MYHLTFPYLHFLYDAYIYICFIFTFDVDLDLLGLLPPFEFPPPFSYNHDFNVGMYAVVSHKIVYMYTN